MPITVAHYPSIRLIGQTAYNIGAGQRKVREQQRQDQLAAQQFEQDIALRRLAAQEQAQREQNAVQQGYLGLRAQSQDLARQQFQQGMAVDARNFQARQGLSENQQRQQLIQQFMSVADLPKGMKLMPAQQRELQQLHQRFNRIVGNRALSLRDMEPEVVQMVGRAQQILDFAKQDEDPIIAKEKRDHEYEMQKQQAANAAKESISQTQATVRAKQAEYDREKAAREAEHARLKAQQDAMKNLMDYQVKLEAMTRTVDLGEGKQQIEFRYTDEQIKQKVEEYRQRIMSLWGQSQPSMPQDDMPTWQRFGYDPTGQYQGPAPQSAVAPHQAQVPPGGQPPAQQQADQYSSKWGF